MSSYLKPQSPLKNGENYIYPITTADQIVMDDGTRLNAEISKHLTIDTNGAESAEPNGINADSLGGYPADDYVRKDQASVEVNYSVVGSLTEPENPRQNMIWIKTDIPIGRVFFGDNEPNETFINGDVWIQTGVGSSAPFNSLNINGMYVNMIYPLSAYQYIDDVSTSVTAKSYQDNKWVEWVPYGALYFMGNECTTITGGWKSRAAGQSSGGWTQYAPTVTNDGTKLILNFTNISSTTAVNGLVETVNAVDISDFDYIIFDISNYTKGGNTTLLDFAAVYDIGGNPYSSCLAKANLATGVGAVKIDVSSLSGSYTIGILLAQNSSSTAILHIDKIMRVKE